MVPLPIARRDSSMPDIAGDPRQRNGRRKPNLTTSNVDLGMSVGYWEPHTANTAYCEEKYTHSHYVAEFHNA